MNHILGYLKKKIDVKIIVEMRGRELAHPNMGKDLLERVVEVVKFTGKPQTPAFRERSITMLIKASNQNPA